MLAVGLEPTSSLLKRQVRQPITLRKRMQNILLLRAPHGCRTRLIAIKSRVHDRSANGAKFYYYAFVSVFVSSFFPLLFLNIIAAIGIEPITFRVWTEHSRQLSYAAEPSVGLEPTTRCLQGSRTTSCAITAYPAPGRGLEPPTLRLTAVCSTD